MTTEIMNDLQESIKKNLPAAVGEELRKVLEDGQAAIKKVEELTRRREEDAQQIKTLRNSLDLHKNLDARKLELLEVEKKLNEEKVALIQKEADLRAKVAEAKSTTLEKVFDTIFRVPTVRENVMKTHTFPVDGMPASQYNQGSSGYPHQAHDSSTTVRTEE